MTNGRDALLLGNVDFKGVWFGACVEAGCATNAAFAFVNDRAVAANIEFIADFKALFRTCIDAAAAGFAFQRVDLWIWCCFVHDDASFLLREPKQN